MIMQDKQDKRQQYKDHVLRLMRQQQQLNESQQERKYNNDMFNIESLKSLNIDTPTTEQLVAHSASVRVLRAEFETLTLEVPEWLDEITRKIRREIHARVADARANTLKSIDAELERLKTPTERKAELLARRERLAGVDSGTQVVTNGR